MKIHLLILGIVLAIVYSILFLPNREGGAAGSKKLTFYPFMYEGKIAIPISDDQILHVHHWIIYLILIILILSLKRFLSDQVYYILLGFAATMVIQGLSYSDCFDFIEKRPDGY
jgi:hypothetical protein